MNILIISTILTIGIFLVGAYLGNKIVKAFNELT